MTQYFYVKIDAHNEWRAKQPAYSGIRFDKLTNAVASTTGAPLKASDGTPAMQVKSLHPQGITAIVPMRFLQTDNKVAVWMRYVMAASEAGVKEIRVPAEMVPASQVPFLQLSCGQAGYHCVKVRRVWILTKKEA